MSILTIDDLRFEVRRSAGRRSLEITVDRSGDLILSVPTAAPESVLRDFVQRKRTWVYQQLARQETHSREAPTKVFVDS
jgi:predicted metal-dependent hydrolase